MALLFNHAFRWWVRERPDRVAICVDDEEITYAALDRWSNCVAHWLMDAKGLAKGKVVVIAGDNSMEWCVAAMALMKIGVVIAPANTRYPDAELEYFIGNAGPSLALADAGQIDKLRIVPDRGAGLDIVDLSAIHDLREGDPSPVIVEIAPTDPSMLLYTSGTTGNPKGIVHTNEMMMLAMLEGLLTDPVPPDDTSFLQTLPMFTSAGIYNGMTRVLARGGKLIIMREFEARRALALIMRHRVYQFGGTPVVWEEMARLLPETGSYDFSHMKVAVTGGARLSDEIIARFAARGVHIRQAYGQTEGGGAISFPSPRDVIDHPGTCGSGGIFAELRTARADGTDCAPGRPAKC